MLITSQVSRPLATIRLVLSVASAVLATVLGVTSTTLAADVHCRLKAETEATEVHVLKDGETKWAGSIEKQETKTISMPEGPFTMISKVYNPNLKRKEDIRAELHTRLSEKQTLIVPLFPEAKER